MASALAFVSVSALHPRPHLARSFFLSPLHARGAYARRRSCTTSRPVRIPCSAVAARGAGSPSALVPVLVNLFPVYTIVATVVAIAFPAPFLALPSSVVPVSLSLLMLSMGLTLSFSKLLKSFVTPRPLLLSLFLCFVLMPLVSLFLAPMFKLSVPFAAGLTLLSFISGGQASNLCTHLARGDVALSVSMTTLSTLFGIPLVPFLSTLLLQTSLPVASFSMALTTAKIVLAPIVIGALLSPYFPKRLRPYLPLFGILAVIVLIAVPVARAAPLLPTAFPPLVVPVLCLHVVGGMLGYSLAKILLFADHKAAVTVAFETLFKSPALSYVLASKHFSDTAVALPSIVSIIVLAPLAAAIAIGIRLCTKEEEKGMMDVEKNGGQGVREWSRWRVVGVLGRDKVIRREGLEAELKRWRKAGWKIVRIEPY